MNKFFRGIIAAWGAKKLGGGCLSTIIIFILIYTLLGKCNNKARAAQNDTNHSKLATISTPVKSYPNSSRPDSTTKSPRQNKIEITSSTVSASLDRPSL